MKKTKKNCSDQATELRRLRRLLGEMSTVLDYKERLLERQQEQIANLKQRLRRP